MTVRGRSLGTGNLSGIFELITTFIEGFSSSHVSRLKMGKVNQLVRFPHMVNRAVRSPLQANMVAELSRSVISGFVGVTS